MRIKSTVVLMYIISIVGLVFLYFYNPQDMPFFPRCPFYALTGYKCPGCGTLRAIHALLHCRFANAFNLNPFLFVAIPIVSGVLVSKRFASSVPFGKCVFALTIVYWVLRNVLE